MRRRSLWLALALLLSAGGCFPFDPPRSAWADPLCHLTVTLDPIPTSAVTLTVGASACSLVTCTGGAAIPANAYAALISVESNSIRYWDDGSTPTASAGQNVLSGTSVAACGPAILAKLLFIQNSGSATLRVSFYAK